MEMKKLKVATARMAGYTGVLGPVRFTDGVSDEYLPRHIRDRMAASMEFLEVDAQGNEQPAGAQHRLITESAERAPQLAPLTRQTDAEKAAEIAAAALMSAKVPVLETRANLEELAAKKGIKGLREIGKKWNVKHRAIPTLIEMILDAQEKVVAARAKTEAPAPVVEEPVVVETVDEKADDSSIDPAVAAETERLAAENAAEAEAFRQAQEAIKAAAASGDLAAAISTETPQE
ncbi:hypothetical protein GFL39_25810 [Rhizobium leguminosarum bv. viciae]|uniref:hypothetical protein n=1 Tax=Rhizobium leguminosarum TaxID=384 RepID=UPI00144132A8|nr:hypothetical protein [Rhizobium leguminosarum]NKL08288.1 hypothetical protein [Rhizobium leguminosarum bv. viciae]